MALPGNVGHGTVTGRFIDSTGVPIEGSVTFTPSPKRLLNATAEPSPVTILPQPVTVTLNDGTFTQSLVASDDPDNNPTGWTYGVKFNFKSVSAAGFDIEVPEGATVDLTTVSPVSSGNGTTIIAGRGVPSWDDATDGQVIVLVDGEPAWGNVQGGGGTDLTSYSQVSGLGDYPSVFPPDLTGVTPGDIGAQPAGDYLTEDDLPAPVDLSGYATKAELFSGDYDDLTNKPTIPAPPDLSGYAEKSELFSGAYGDLTGKPSIPTTPQDIGAQPAGSYATAAQGAKADTALQSVTLANLPAGTSFVIVWDGTGWTHGGQTITARPTSRTDLTMMAYGGTEAPTFAIAGDLWTEDAVA